MSEIKKIVQDFAGSFANVYVLYHKNCMDGFGAAWCAWRKFGCRAQYIPVQYGDPLPEMVLGKQTEVYILDFSFSREILMALNEQVGMLRVIDHHKTAEAELAGLPFALFDMDYSGAVLAWKYFEGESVKVPLLLQYIEDRDLWRWDLLDSLAINNGLALEAKCFSLWDVIYQDWDLRCSEIKEAGYAVMGYQRVLIETRIENAWWGEIDGCRCIMINSCMLQSEIADALLREYPEARFAAVFYEKAEGRVYSLRSRGSSERLDGFDVGKLARKFGGGGHRCAAAFKLNGGRI